MRVLNPVQVKGPTRTSILMLPDNDHITNVIRTYKAYYEWDLLEAIRKQKRQGVYVDVGAHYGNHSVFFAIECLSSRVISIEANPSNFYGLQQSILANKLESKIYPINVAIHSSWKKVKPSIPCETNTGTGMVEEDSQGLIDARRLDEILFDIEDIAEIGRASCRERV